MGRTDRRDQPQNPDGLSVPDSVTAPTEMKPHEIKPDDQNEDQATHLAAAIYRVTINRLAIQVRSASKPDIDPDLAWQLTRQDWQTAADALKRFIGNPGLQPDQRPAPETSAGLLKALAPYDRPDVSPEQLQPWRDLDFMLEDQLKARKGQAIPAWRQAHVIPLAAFYTGLKRIDQRVATLYDAKRYEKLMSICLWIGGVLLAITVITAVAKGIRNFDWTQVPLEGSLGVMCGLALGVLLDYRRRIKTRNLIEDLGDQFGCDLRGMRWRQLPVFTRRIEQELARIGGGEWVTMTPERREATLNSLRTPTGD